MSHCIIAEGIDPQMFGALIERPDNITIHHCLWSNNQSRNPKGKAKLQYFNNVVYNWKVSGFGGGHSAADHYQDLINNYFIAGPNSNNSFVAGFTATDHVYHSGNYVDLNKDGVLNGRLVTDGDLVKTEPAPGSRTTSGEKMVAAAPTLVSKPSNTSPVPVIIEDAAVAYEKVLAKAGASLRRDAVDVRQVAHMRSLGKDGAIILRESDVGGQPEMKGGPAPKDSDRDGIPDEWEIAHGLNPDDASDAGKLSASGYTHLEVYLNSLVPAD